MQQKQHRGVPFSSRLPFLPAILRDTARPQAQRAGPDDKEDDEWPIRPWLHFWPK